MHFIKSFCMMGILIGFPVECSKFFVFVGPSGAGKTTMIRMLKEGGYNFNDIISHTTRPQRTSEQEGKDYFFVSLEEYKQKEDNGDFIMSTQVHGNWYGIAKDHIEELLRSDKDVMCSVNIEAICKLQNMYGKSVIGIFMKPSNYQFLQDRIQKRGDDSETVRIRMKNAHEELKEQDEFTYKVINDEISYAFKQVEKIMEKEKSLRYEQQQEVANKEQNDLRAMSYNIRMAPFEEDDNNENAWRYRLPKVMMLLKRYSPDIVGLQEISDIQTADLKESCGDFEYLCKAPDRKPVEAGLGIAYNPQTIECISELKVFWLNEKQETANAPAWDGSDYEKYVIYAKFYHKGSNKTFWFMTTHFDHMGIEARRESAKLVMDRAATLDAPVIVTGDFNCFPQLGGAELYELLCTRNEKIVDSGATTDSIVGVPGTWMGWEYDFYHQKAGYAKYDFIFVDKVIISLQHAVIDDQVWDSRFGKKLYPSDHRPVLSDLRLS